ncbi:unnamed protein product [Ectocarpus sp. 6 AP-2014]
MNQNRNPLRRTDFPQISADDIPECEGKSRRDCKATPRCQYFSNTCIPNPRQLVANQLHGNQGEVNRTISAISEIPVGTVKGKFNAARGREENDDSAMQPNQNRWFATKLISRLRGLVQGNANSDNYPIDIGDDRKWSPVDKTLMERFVEENVAQDRCLFCHDGPLDDSSLEQMSCCGVMTHELCASGYYDSLPNATCANCQAPRPDGHIQDAYDPLVAQYPDVELVPDEELHGADDDPYILIGNPGPTVAVDNANGFFSFPEVADPIISDEDLIGLGGVDYAPDDDGNCVTGNLQNDRCRVDLNFALMISKVCIDSDIVEFGMDVRMSRYVREIHYEIDRLPVSTMFRQGLAYHHVDLDLYNNDHVLVLRQARTCGSLSNISTTFNGGRFPKLARTDNGGANPSLISGSLIVKNQSASPLELGPIASQIEFGHVYSLKTNNVSSNAVSLRVLFENWKVSRMHDIQIQGITGPVQNIMIQLANSAEWLRYDQELNDEPYSMRLAGQQHRTIQHYNSTGMLHLTNSERESFASG